MTRIGRSDYFGGNLPALSGDLDIGNNAAVARIGHAHQLWSIQYLRALAAIAVIVFHVLQGVRLTWLGEYGVDLFFVISGFMMAVMTAGRAIRPERFVVDRVTRVVPLYWLATLITAAGVAIGVPLIAASADPQRLLFSLLFIPIFGKRGEIWPTLFLGWTLNYEMFFYLVFAGCLFAPRRWQIPVLSIALGGLFGLGRLMEPSGAVLRIWTNPLLLEFLAGTWVGTIAGPRGDRSTPARSAVLMLVPAAMLIAAAVTAPRLGFGAASVIVVAIGMYVERRGLLPRWPALKQLGDASYSIYLFQGFALTAVTQSLTVVARHTGLPLELVRFTAPIGLVVAVGGGYAVSMMVEHPLTASLRIRSKRVLNRPVRLS